MLNHVFGTTIAGLKSLVFPEICIMCNSVYATICRTCNQVWQQPTRQVIINGLTLRTVVAYDDQVSKVVLQAKEDGNQVAQKLLADTLTRSVLSWSPQIDLRELVLVPIPSSRQAIRRRGRSFLHPILNQVIRNLSDYGVNEVFWNEMLIHTKKVKDQAALSHVARMANLDGAFRIREPRNKNRDLTGRPILLVDDVVTTGATILSAANALIERKMTVLGASSACASAHQLLIR